MSLNSQRGFSTIEVIAALVIFSLAIIPLTQVQIYGQSNAEYLRDEIELAELEKFALNQFKLMNIGARPNGEMRILNGTMTWTSEPADPAGTIIQARDTGVLEISLYRVKLTLTLQNKSTREKIYYSVGWKEL